MTLQVIRILLLIIFAVWVSYGQRADTQFFSVWTTADASNFATPVPILRTIGQSGHLLNIAWSNVSGQDCRTRTGHRLQYLLEGSNDNITWFVIRSVEYTFNQSDAAGNIASTVEGYGAYPYLRARVIYLSGAGTTNLFAACRLNGWYVGTITGNRQPTDRLLGTQDSFQRYSASVNGAGNLIANSVLYKSIYVWGGVICSNGVNDVNFSGGVAPLYRTLFTANSDCVVLPYTGVYYFRTDNGFALSVNTSAVATVNLIWSTD